MNGPLAVASARPRVGPIRALGLAAVGRFPAVAALVGAAWLTLVLADLSGNAAAFHHHALIEGGVPPALAVLAFMTAWQVMVVAMMWPASLHAIASVGRVLPRAGRTGPAVASFLGAFATVWAVFGLAAFLGDVVLHRVVDTTPWLAARPWLIEAAVLATAGGWQLTPLKRRSMAACRRPDRSMVSAEAMVPAAWRLGVRHGIDCLASTWALMLVMFAAGFGALWSMVVLTLLMAYEVTGHRGRRAATASGVLLVLLALWVVAAPLPGAA